MGGCVTGLGWVIGMCKEGWEVWDELFGNHQHSPLCFPPSPWQCSLLFSSLICFLNLAVFCVTNPKLTSHTWISLCCFLVWMARNGGWTSFLNKNFACHVSQITRRALKQNFWQKRLVLAVELLLAVHPQGSQQTQRPFSCGAFAGFPSAVSQRENL